MNKPKLNEIVASVERELATVYAFAPVAAATDHLIQRDDIHKTLGDTAKEQPEWHARGGVWLSGDESDLFIGIHIDDAVTEHLTEHCPLTRLASHNLDAFCVVVEEVSHFHMILNRVGRGVSKLELECQGEIDKLLVAARLLERQCGRPHLTALARVLFDEAHVVGADTATYEAATRYAARWWYAVTSGDDRLTAAIITSLRSQYKTPLVEKLAASVSLKQAS